MYSFHVPDRYGDKKSVESLLNLELQAVVSCPVSAGHLSRQVC